MIQIRRAGERGHFDHGWLDTNHTFSFADYEDPRHMGFRSLRVINEDRVAPGQGFGTHGHRDMEIVSYVLEGALAHEDSMGTGSVITPGDVQYMSAGTGVRHSEYNASDAERTHFLQIWILPDRDGYAPRYGQKRFERADKLDRLRLVVSPDGADGSIAIRQDAKLYASVLEGGEVREPRSREGPPRLGPGRARRPLGERTEALGRRRPRGIRRDAARFHGGPGRDGVPGVRPGLTGAPHPDPSDRIRRGGARPRPTWPGGREGRPYALGP